jgi:hypothetical protein
MLSLALRLFSSTTLSRGAFSPATLFAANEPGIWLDPSDLSTVFTDTAGTTLATVGQAVARINDKSGNGFHATQATTARRPILRQDSEGLYYLEFDGVDDGMSTGTITPGTDKVQVIAGVRKLSDAAIGIIAETSANAGANNGSFFLSCPTAVGQGTFRFNPRGTENRAADTTNIFPAPITSVVSGIAEISTDTSLIRVDGVQRGSNNLDQGTGNYLAYPLFVGARNNAAARFNGHIYSLIVRFGPNLDTSTITQAEQFVAAKTGVTL